MKSWLVAAVILLIAGSAFAEWGYIEEPFYGYVTDLERLPSGAILAGTSGGMFASMDDGQSWFFTGVGSLDNSNAGNDVIFDAHEDEDGEVYIAMENVYVSGPSLTSFDPVYLPGDVYGIESIVKVDGVWILASRTTIWRSTDDLASFEEVYDLSPVFNDILSLVVNPVDGTIVGHLSSAGGTYFLISDDVGQTWTEQQITDVYGTLFSPQFMDDGTLYFGNNYQNEGHIRYTNDYGVTNTDVYSPGVELGELTIGDNGRMAVTRYNGVIISTDCGSTFSDVINEHKWPEQLLYVGQNLLIGNRDGLHYTTDDGGSWTTSNDGLMAQLLEDADIDLDGDLWISNSSFVMKQEDSSWIVVNDGTLYTTAMGVTQTGRMLLFGRHDDTGLLDCYYSDNAGQDWTVADGIGVDSWAAFTNFVDIGNGTLYVGNEELGPYMSTDNGSTWTLISDEAPGRIAVDGEGTLYVTHWSGAKMSADGGTTWTTLGNVSAPVKAAASPVDDTFLVDDWGSLKRLNEDDETWTTISTNIYDALDGDYLDEISAYDFDLDGTLYVMVVSQGLLDGRKRSHMMMSEDNGDTFTDVTGWSQLSGAQGGFVRRTGDGQMIAITNMGVFGEAMETSVENSETSATAPLEFELAQNSPNPFNPETRIAFSLPSGSQVTLAVYDVLGREVARLVDGSMSAGAHSVEFDGSALSSGLYFYRLEANGLSQVRRMVLMK